MKKSFCLILLTLLLLTLGCSGCSDNSDKELYQDAHLVSVNVKVINAVEDRDDQFVVEALEDSGKKIKQGDTILVTADDAAISEILKSYQENNKFCISFPVIKETSDGMSVTCFDVRQYDSANKVIEEFPPMIQ